MYFPNLLKHPEEKKALKNFCSPAPAKFFLAGLLFISALAVLAALAHGQECRSDCVNATSGACSLSCDGKGGCDFSQVDAQIKNSCDGYFKGIISISDTENAFCCKGPSSRKLPAAPTTCAEADTIGAIRDFAIYQGRIASIVVVTLENGACGAVRTTFEPENVCGKSRNRCKKGNTTNTTENVSHYNWKCEDQELAKKIDCSARKKGLGSMNGACGSFPNTCIRGFYKHTPGHPAPAPVEVLRKKRRARSIMRFRQIKPQN